MIRRCTLDDVPWIVIQARLAYERLVEEYSDAGAEKWAIAVIQSEKMIAMRGDKVVGLGTVLTMPWAPTYKFCDLTHLFRAPGKGVFEAFDVVKAIYQKCGEMGCRKMFIGSIFADLSPIAERLGGKPLNRMWVVDV
jgi:hypothetical protein